MTDTNSIGSHPTTAEARAVGITGGRWPYGPGPKTNDQSRRALVDWATAHRLRYNPHTACLDWLRTGRCPHHGACPIGGWLDHVTAWTRDKKPAVLVAQPYGLTGDRLAELAEIDRADNGLEVHIDGTGWYGHRTTFVGVWRVNPHG